MRRLLDGLYALTSVLAALALVAIAVIVVAQMTGRWSGIQVRSADEFAGYALVATGFLGLAPTYRAGEHIRVSLLVDRLGGRVKHGFETVILVVAAVALVWATVWAGRFVYDSFRFHEMSQGLVPVPMWIPQAPMVFGLGVFALTVIDDLAGALRGRTPSHLAPRSADAGPGFER
jgi:TRAP-type C4-dicarboxylate transport system permease small subunit